MPQSQGLTPPLLLLFQLRDFLLVYNRMTELCFLRCISNLNYRALTREEVSSGPCPGMGAVGELFPEHSWPAHSLQAEELSIPSSASQSRGLSSFMGTGIEDGRVPCGGGQAVGAVGKNGNLLPMELGPS